jgi:hypothetical protein
MATKPEFFTEHYRATEAEAAASLRSPLAAPRVLFTDLTNKQLADHGLFVAPARRDSVQQNRVSVGNVVPLAPVTQWLVQEAVDHRGRHGLPSWFPLLASRIDDLRVIATDDELPFSETSATAALAFAKMHGRSRQPSAFLIGNGNIRLLWLNDAQEQVGLQFREDKDVQVVLFEQSSDRLDPITAHKRADDVMPFVERNRLTRLF